MNKKDLRDGAIFVTIAACCLIIPILLVGGLGLITGIFLNNFIVILGSLSVFLLGLYIYLIKRQKRD